MQIQDEMRVWINSELTQRGRGARKELAEFLGIPRYQLTRMLNTKKGKETRGIRADEWLRIENFFATENTQKKIKNPVFSGRERYMEIYDSASPKLQRTLLEIVELLSVRAKKR